MKILKVLAIAGLLLLSASCQSSELSLGGHTVKETYENADERSLVEAAIRGDSKSVVTLKSRGVNVNALSSTGATPLMWSVHARSLQGTKALLDAGADPNQRSAEGFLVMESLSVSDQSAMLQLLLDHGADPNLPTSDYSPTGSMLGNAAEEGRLDNVRALVNAGADIRRRDRSGVTAVEYAIALGNFDIALYLLQSGYDVDLSHVAGLTQTRLVSKEREPDRQAVIAWLKSHGVQYPAYHKSRDIGE